MGIRVRVVKSCEGGEIMAIVAHNFFQ